MLDRPQCTLFSNLGPMSMYKMHFQAAQQCIML